jgi:hypothetical protein
MVLPAPPILDEAKGAGSAPSSATGSAGKEKHMTRGSQTAIAVLAVAVVALAIGLMMALAWDHDPDHMNARSNDYMAMMDALGRMDSDEMLSGMESALGSDGYQTMLAHMADHRRGNAMTPGSGIDGMMHMMMDGMMNQMPADRNNTMPMSPR